MKPWDWNASTWGAFGQVGALAVAVVAGFLVWQQVRQGRQAREDQTRPYVIVDFEFRGVLVALCVKNVGANPARDVRVTFDKALQPPGDVEIDKFAVFERGIPMLAPGRSISVWFGIGHEFFSSEGGVPLRYDATPAYTDLSGKRTYVDPPCVLDLLPYKHALVQRDDMQDVARRIKGIETIMKSWTARQRLNINVITQAEVNAADDEWLAAQETTSESGPSGAGGSDS